VRTLTRRDLASWSLSRKASDTYKSVRARHQNPDTGELVEFSSEYKGGEDVSDDTLELHGRYESEQQAREAADAELTERNTSAIEGSISKEGDIGLISGANIELPDIGRYSGIFTITESTHSIDRSGGYATSASIKRVRR
jgi:phage protein D